MTNNIQQNMRSTEDWAAFMEDASEHFGVPVDTLHKIALYFVAQEYYGGSLQQESRHPTGRTTLRTLKEHIKRYSR